MKKVLAVFLSILFVFSSIPYVVATETSSGTIEVSSAEAVPGETIELKVAIKDNPGINTFSLGFSYDTTRLSLKSVTPSSGLGGQFTYAKKAVWLNSSDTTYNGEILTLSFEVLSSAKDGEAAVAVTYSAGDISNYNEDDVNFDLVAGKVTVKSPKEEIGGGTIEVSSAEAAPGETVELKVSIKDNPGINTFSLGFSYDTTRLNLKSVTPSSGLGGQFTYAKKAVWLNSSDTTYNGEILTLSFEVLPSAKDGEAAVAVTYSAGDISNYNEDDVNFGLVAGKVTVKTKATIAEAKYEVTSATALTGKSVTVYVSIASNPGIISLRNTVSYDESVMELTSVSNLRLLNGYTTPSASVSSPYTLRWADSLATVNNTENGRIVALTFSINEDAPVGDYNVTVDHVEARDCGGNKVLFTSATGVITVIDVLKGDVDADGEINDWDAILLNRFLADWDVDVIEAACDIDEDGEISDWDAILLERHLAGWTIDQMQ
ncbi:MAG: cohesin domain-containing protein [Acutalibacteraceae bacterium]